VYSIVDESTGLNFRMLPEQGKFYLYSTTIL